MRLANTLMNLLVCYTRHLPMLTMTFFNEYLLYEDTNRQFVLLPK